MRMRFNIPIKIFFLLIGMLFTRKVFSQSTWVITPAVDQGTSGIFYSSNNIGPVFQLVDQEGYVITTVVKNQANDIVFIKMDTLGNILYQTQIGTSHTLSWEHVLGLSLTSDTGYVYLLYHSATPPNETMKVVKRNKNGSIIWTKLFGLPDLIFPSSISTSLYNTVYIQFGDSLAEYESNGNYIRSLNVEGKIIPLPDSGFIAVSDDTIQRRDHANNLIWSNPFQTSSVESVNMSYFYVNSYNKVFKINTVNGTILNSVNDTLSKISPTIDGGFVGIKYYHPETISKYDWQGNLEWIKGYNFSYDGLKSISELKDHSYIMGGSWKNKSGFSIYDDDYSSFFMRVDSNGNGVIDSTNYYFPGNANNNNKLSVADDGAYIASLLGTKGLPRCPILEITNFSSTTLYSVFGTDWSDNFPCKPDLKLKYSDITGDGMIDTADISGLFSVYPALNSITAAWQRTSSNSLYPPLVFNLRNDSINPGDTITIDVIAGTQTDPIDSVYAISFSMTLDRFFSSPLLHGISYSLTSTLGDTLTNLYSRVEFPLNSANHFGTLSAVLSRRDSQSVTLHGDTILTANFLIDSSFFNNPFSSFQVLHCYAEFSIIKQCGESIIVNPIMDSSVAVSSVSPTAINEIGNLFLKIYPNPSSKEILISGLENSGQLMVYDMTGKLLEKIDTQGSELLLNVVKYPEGIYWISYNNENSLSHIQMIITR